MRKEIMSKLILRLSIILAVFFMFNSCKKEFSLEKGGYGGIAEGQLVDSLGNCKAPTIVGDYKVDTPVSSITNYVLINVNFTTAGKYYIYSDTVNGMWFLDSGYVVSAGAAVIKLKGYGTPILPKKTSFALIFNNNLCGFSIAISGSVSGGGGGGGGTSGTGSKGDYFPTTNGSSFVYEYIPKIRTIDTFSVKVALGLIPIDSLNYAQFATRLQDTFYFAKDGKGTYYTYSTVDFDYTFLFDSIPNKFISYPFLKEGAAVGDTWESGVYGTVKLITAGVTEYGDAKAVFTIISKNLSTPYTVGGRSYSNVINVKRDIMFRPTGGAYRLLLSGNSYYAKDYGLIDQKIGTQFISLYQTPVIK